MKLPDKITEDYLMSFDNVPAPVAAKYLGITPQAARCFAKEGRIGCKRPECNKVYISPKMLIRFKNGENYEERYSAAARILKDAGFSDLCATIAAAILRVIDERTS